MGLRVNSHCCRFSSTGLRQIRILVGVLSRFKGDLFDRSSRIYGFLDLDSPSNIELDLKRLPSAEVLGFLVSSRGAGLVYWRIRSYAASINALIFPQNAATFVR